MSMSSATNNRYSWIKKYFRNTGTGFIAIAVLMIAMIWMTAFYQVNTEYKSELAAVTNEHDSLATAVEERIRGMLQLSDNVLVLTKQIYEHSLSSDQDFNSDTYILKNVSFITQLTIVNERGEIVFKEFAEKQGRSSVNESDYFLAHRLQDNGILYIGKPLYNSEEQKWLVPISRRVNKPDGAFLGVVAAHLDLYSVFDLLHKTNNVNDHLFELIGLDGIARIRWYNHDISGGQHFGPFLSKYIDHSSQGSFISKSFVDGIERISNYRMMDDYPLIVVCGVDESNAMAGFYERRNNMYGLALFLSIFVATAFFLLFHLVRKRQSAEYLLHRNALQYQHLAQHSKDIILVQNRVGRVIFISPAAQSILGYDEKTLFKGLPYDLVYPDDLAAVRTAYDRLASGENSVTFEFRAIAAQDTYVWLESHATRLDDEEHCLIGYQSVLRDISRQKEAEERVLDISSHDNLTGIYNRHYFEIAMEEFDQEHEVPVAVIVIDIIGLKLINESYGHGQGDQILVGVTNVLTASATIGDIVARTGGDDFSMLLKDASSERAENVVASIRHQIDSINLAQIKSGIRIDLSIGYSWRPTSADKLDSTSIQDLFNRANLNMQQEQARSGQMAMSAIVETLKRTLAARDFTAQDHSDRLYCLIEKMATGLGFDDNRVKNILSFAELHDIGKVGIPDRILQKTGPLTEEEKMEMQRHSEIGYRIALAAPELAPIAEWILKHHEWWDGTGYPLGLRGTDIPLECRILSIVDAYDAMVHDRTCLSQEEAIAELRHFAGRQFDPRLTALFIDLIEEDTLPQPQEVNHRDSSSIRKLSLVRQFETVRKCIADLHSDWQEKNSVLDEFFREEALDKEVDPARAEELTRLFVRKILDSMPNPAFIKDKHGYFVYCNSSFYQSFGISQDEVIGRRKTGIITKEETQRSAEQELELLNGSPGLVKDFQIHMGSREDTSLLFKKTIIRDDQSQAIGIVGVMTDSSMHQYVNKTLQRYHLILNRSRDVILLIRPEDGQILESNLTASELYGYSRSELRTMSIYDLRDTGNVQIINDQMNKASGTGIQFTAMHRCKDGTIIPVLIHSGGAEIDGKPVLVSIIRDIRDWVKVSDDLKRHNEYLTILHDTTLSLVNHLDLQDLLDKIVARAADLFKTPHAYLFLQDKDSQQITMKVGVGICEALVGLKLHPGEGVAGMAWQTGQPFCMQQYNSWDGRPKIQGLEKASVVLGVPLKLKDNIIGVFGIFSTDDGRCFTQEEIQLAQGFGELASLAINNASLYDTIQLELAERKKLKEAVAQSPNAVVITDREGIIEYVNPKFCQMTGYDIQEAIGENPRLLNSGECSPDTYKELWETIKSGHEWSGEIRNKKKSGEFYWARATIGPIRDLEGNITHFLGIQEDVTHRKQMEEELLRNNSALAEALDVLKNTQSSLIQQEKFAGIGQLAAGVAHEINNPLGFVLSNFETLQKYTVRLSDMVKAFKELHMRVLEEKIPSLQEKAAQVSALEKQTKLNYILEDLEPIFSETADGLMRVGNIVKALRHFSRVDHQGIFEEYDLNEGLRNSLTVARNEIRYVADVQENLAEVPTIRALSGQVNQVLLNILINAAYGIKAKGTESRGLITISTYADDRFIYCSIADSGIGIPEEIRKKIFDPFFTTKPVGQGTGLGLSISYDIIVNKHQGEILLESELGKGSTFIIKLPIYRQTVEDC